MLRLEISFRLELPAECHCSPRRVLGLAAIGQQPFDDESRLVAAMTRIRLTGVYGR
jgi:hypothetical protein